MVVLDQHRVVEPEAVVAATASAHRILFEGAKSGGGFPGTHYPRRVRSHARHEIPGGGRDPAEPAEKIEGRAFRSEKGARGAADRGENLTCGNVLAIRCVERDMRRAIRSEE